MPNEKEPDLGRLEALYGWRLTDAVSREGELHLTFEMPQGRNTEPKRTYIACAVRTKTTRSDVDVYCDECEEYTSKTFEHEVNPVIHIK